MVYYILIFDRDRHFINVFVNSSTTDFTKIEVNRNSSKIKNVQLPVSRHIDTTQVKIPSKIAQLEKNNEKKIFSVNVFMLYSAGIFIF